MRVIFLLWSGVHCSVKKATLYFEIVWASAKAKKAANCNVLSAGKGVT